MILPSTYPRASLSLLAWSPLWGRAVKDSSVETLLEHSWPWSPAVTGLLVMAIVALVIFLYRNVPEDVPKPMRWLLGLLRIGSLGLILIMMYGFALRPHRVDLPDLEILIDDSLSMSLVDQCLNADQGSGDDERSGRDHELDGRKQHVIEALVKRAGLEQTTRFNQAIALLLERSDSDLEDLFEQYHVHLHWLGRKSVSDADGIEAFERLRLRDHQPECPASRLGDRLVDILHQQRGRSTAAILLFSDGITSEGRSLADAARIARRRSVPLIVVGIGSDRPARDIRLSDVLVEDQSQVHDVVRFDFSITAVEFDGRKVEVRLRDADSDATIARRTVVLGADSQPVKSSLIVRPTEVGRREFILEVAPQRGEVNDQNNRKRRQVDVRDDPLRVLLVQEDANYEFRFLKHVLERGLAGSDVSAPFVNPVQLQTVLQYADSEYATTDATALRDFPARREELFQYDVLILGDVDPNLLGRAAQQQIVDFVKSHGGGLMMMAGPRFMPQAFSSSPLAELIPIDISGAQQPYEETLDQPLSLRLTPLGLVTSHLQIADQEADNAAAWPELPPLYWLLRTVPINDSASVLVESQPGRDHTPWPVVYLRYVGAGKVVFHATDETWRWRFRRGDGTFDRYWTQTIRYLARRQRDGLSGVRLTTDRRQYRLGEPVRVQARFVIPGEAPPAADGVQILVSRPADRERLIRLQRVAARRDVFAGIVSDLSPGNYRLSLTEPALERDPPAREIEVLNPPRELSEVAAGFAPLREAAVLSGGAYYDVPAAHDLFEHLPSGTRVEVEALAPIPIWNSWKLVVLLMSLLAAEWLLRKSVGLV